ncbi:MAG: hypothetical protein QOG91_604 [Candidatus Parcubacteria bacterium]|jgi:hypothetical protein|nr:hypothetical protein [Candidatus Parcubacteria bacterium]
MSKFERPPGKAKNKAENAAEKRARKKSPESRSKKEKEPSVREVGRDRIDRIGSFFGRMKEGFKNKAGRAGEAISKAAGRAKDIGIAGMETVMGAPEAIGRGVEFGVGALAMTYEKSKDMVVGVKDKLIEAKNSVIARGKGAIEKGMQTVVDAKNATIEFGNRALYRASERISRPFLNFQNRRLEHTVRYVNERVDRGKANKSELAEVKRLLQRLLAHLEGMGDL